MFLNASAIRQIQLRLSAVPLITVLLCASASAQQRASNLTALKEQIDSQSHLIELATKQESGRERLGYLWAQLAALYSHNGEFSQSESAYLKSLDLQRDLPAAARNYATTLDNLGSLYVAYGRVDDAERYNRLGLEVRTAIGDRLSIARSDVHRAEIELAKHKFKQSEAAAEEALKTMEAENDPEPADRLMALNALAFSRCMQKRCEQGSLDAHESLRIATSKFGPRSMSAAHSLMAVGFADWKNGHAEEAEQEMKSALAVLKDQPVPGRSLLLALAQYRNFLQSQRRSNEAALIDSQMSAAKQGSGYCSDCVSVSSLR